MNLLFFDFDGTVANTSTNQIEGVIASEFVPSVEEAYDMAVWRLFGNKGQENYRNTGGLNNEAPSEVVLRILNCDTGQYEFTSQAKADQFTPGSREELLTHAKDKWAEIVKIQDYDRRTHLWKPYKFVADNKGYPLVWNDDRPEELLTEVLVRFKLLKLLGAIGSECRNYGSFERYKWPAPCKGFLSFWQTLQTLRANDVPFCTAVVSSGHQLFIENTFKMWKMNPPDIIVTDDDIRGMQLPSEARLRYKPSALMACLAYQQYKEMVDSHLAQHEGFIMAPILERNMMLFGDSQSKDGGMAEAIGAPFGQLLESDSNPWFRVNKDKRAITFNNWETLAAVLQSETDRLKEGAAFYKVLSEARPNSIEGPPSGGRGKESLWPNWSPNWDMLNFGY